MKLKSQATQKDNKNELIDRVEKLPIFSKDYVDFLNDEGWILERKLPSNKNHYSDLLEDTDWVSKHNNFGKLRHYRRDLDALS